MHGRRLHGSGHPLTPARRAPRPARRTTPLAATTVLLLAAATATWTGAASARPAESGSAATPNRVPQSITEALPTRPASGPIAGVVSAETAGPATRRPSVSDTVAALAPTDLSGTAGAESPAHRERPLRSFTLAAVGDVLTENAVLDAGAAAAQPGQRYDFAPVFAPVAPIIAGADLAICHMEIPVGRPGDRPGAYGRSPFGGNLLLAPAEIATGLKATGFDRCSTASNHANDLGAPGIDSTLEVFDAAGLGHSGTARTPDEAGVSGVVVNGVWVAHLSYTRYSNTARPADGWRMSYAATPAQIARDVAAARAAGAEVVVVSLHISHELDPEPIPADRRFVEELTQAAHIDLIVEHGPHVIQPLESVNGTPVFWSVANFVSGMGQPGATRYGPPTLDGLIGLATVSETSPGQFRVDARPLLICNQVAGRIVHPARATLADPATPGWLRDEMAACLARAERVIPNVD